MGSNLIFLSLVFLGILLLTGYLISISIDGFKSSDPIISAIDKVKKSFINLEATAKKAKKTIVSTPDGQTPVASLVSSEYQHLDSLKSTYMSLSGSPDAATINTMQTNLNQCVVKYNYINTYLKLGLPTLMVTIKAPTGPSGTGSKKGSKKRKSIKGHGLGKRKGITGKSLSRRTRSGKKGHHSIAKLKKKNSILKSLLKMARSGKGRSGRKRSGRKSRSGRKRSGRKSRSGRKHK